MERQAKRGAAGRGSRHVAKLLKVLVTGGAVLASSCASTNPKGGSRGDASAQGAPSRDGRADAPEQGGGVQGW